jgi:hypothetical protein
MPLQRMDGIKQSSEEVGEICDEPRRSGVLADSNFDWLNILAISYYAMESRDIEISGSGDLYYSERFS